jgi:hypothetical protein
MAQLSDVGQYFGSALSSNGFAQTMAMLGWILFVGVWFVMIYAIYVWFIKYKYKVFYPELDFVDDSKKIARVMNIKTDRGGFIKNKLGQKTFKLLFAKEELKNVQQEDILPGKKLGVLKVANGSWQVGFPQFSLSEKPAMFESIEPEASYWAALSLQEDTKIYQDESAQKRMLGMTLLAVFGCLAFAVSAIYISTKYAGGHIEVAGQVGDQLGNIASLLQGG